MAINNTLYEEATGSVVSSTEYSLTNDSTTIAARTTAAVLSIFIDLTDMIAGDELEIAIQEKVATGGTQRRIVLASLVGAQPDPFIMSGLQVGIGWDVTAKFITGSATLTWTIRAITA